MESWRQSWKEVKEVMAVTGNFFGYGRFFQAYAGYIVIQLGRGVVISIAVLMVILFLRKTVLQNRIFLKGMIWSLLLLTPFMGRLTWIYENRWGYRLLFWWHDLCSLHLWFNWFYLMGMAGMGLYLFRQRRKLKSYISGLRETTICKTRVCVSDTVVSPFTTGLIKPRIVVPQKMLEQLDEAELNTILLHEKVHIRLGHLWCYFLWDVLRVLLWMNPLFTICLKYFQADLEDVCDRVTLQRGEQTAYGYGILLLKSMQMLPGNSREINPTAAFTGEKEYQEFKQRIKRIASYKPYRREGLFILAVIGVLLFAGAFAGIKSMSYPGYTGYDDIVVCSKTGKEVLVEDNSRLRQVVHIDEKNVYVDTEGLEAILQERHLDEDMIVLYFGGFSKLPGIGGGGNAIFVELDEQTGEQTIPYQSEDKDMMTWLFKHL